MNPIAIWNKLPAEVRKFFGIGITVGVGLAIPLTIWLLWASGYIPDKLGIDRDALDQQTEDIRDANTQAMEHIAGRVVQASDSSLRAYLHAERSFAEDTILYPLLQELKLIKGAQAHMLRSQKDADGRMQETTTQLDEKLERVLRNYQPERAEQQLTYVIEQLNELRTEAEEIREQNRRISDELRGRDVKKQRF